MEYFEPKIRFWRREQTFKEWKCFIALCHSTITGLRSMIQFYLEGKMMLGDGKTLYSSVLCLMFYLIDQPVMNIILAYVDLPLIVEDFYTSLEINNYHFKESGSYCLVNNYQCWVSEMKYILSGLCVILNLCKIVPLLVATIVYIHSFGFKPFPHKNSKILLGTRDNTSKNKGYPVEEMMQFFDQHSTLKSRSLTASKFLNVKKYREELQDMYRKAKTTTIEQVKNSRDAIHALATIPVIKQTNNVPKFIGLQKVFFHSIADVNKINDPPTP
uniref:Chloride channel CLIC-like protein 1 n=1 Tax=Strongyloides papillosus TaxID=174720 RepID=A0A0N5BT71_STREA